MSEQSKKSGYNRLCIGTSSLIAGDSRKTNLFFEMDSYFGFEIELILKLRSVIEKYRFDAILIRSSISRIFPYPHKKGYHIVSPEIFAIDEALEIQNALGDAFAGVAKLDYLTIDKAIGAKIRKANIVGKSGNNPLAKMGNVLRSSDKPKKPIIVACVIFSTVPSERAISERILEIYSTRGMRVDEYSMLRSRHRIVAGDNLTVVYETRRV